MNPEAKRVLQYKEKDKKLGKDLVCWIHPQDGKGYGQGNAPTAQGCFGQKIGRRVHQLDHENQMKASDGAEH